MREEPCVSTTTLLKKELGSSGCEAGMKRYGWPMDAGGGIVPLTLDDDFRCWRCGLAKGLFGMGVAVDRGRGEVGGGGGGSIGRRLIVVLGALKDEGGAEEA